MLAAAGIAITGCEPVAQPSAPTPGAGGAGEPPPAPAPDPAPPPTPQETEKRWAIAPAHFRDDDGAIWAETSNRSDPFAWDRITAANAAAVRVSIDGEPLPLENLSFQPVFDADVSGAEWELKAEVTAGAVVLVLTAEDQSYPGEVRSVTLTDGGSGYTSAPSVSFSPAPAGGSDATGTAVGPFGMAVTVTDEGDYASAPTVTFSAPTGGGTAATGTASITGVVKLLGLLNGGSGYTFANVSITGGGSGATGATASATLTNGEVTSITLTNRGSGYTSAPTVSITGDGEVVPENWTGG